MLLRSFKLKARLPVIVVVLNCLLAASTVLAEPPSYKPTKKGVIKHATDVVKRVRATPKTSERLKLVLEFKAHLYQTREKLGPINSEQERAYQYAVRSLHHALDVVDTKFSLNDCESYRMGVLRGFDLSKSEPGPTNEEPQVAYDIIDALCSK